MPEDSELNDEDFDAQFDQNPVEEPEPEPETEVEEEEEFDEEPEAETEDPEPETEAEDTIEEEPEETEDASEESQDDSEEDEDFDKPVSEGEFVEVEIEDLGSKGDGIARKEGFVIFVPGGEVGETYEIEVTSVGRKFAFGEIAE